MRNFFMRLRAAWHYVRYYPHVVIPQGFWLPEDSKALSNFLTGPTGTKLRNLRWQQLRELERDAIQDRKDSSYTKGIAWGVRSYFGWEDTLLQISPAESESQQTTDKDEGLFVSVNR